jgi:hypothetical protein
MKANFKKAIMASGVFGMLAGPYFASDAEAICLISCSRRTNAASTTTQTQSNSQYGFTQGHTLDTYSSQRQSGDISVGNFAVGNTAYGPVVGINGDNSGAINASMSNNYGYVGNTFGHSAIVAPQASGDTTTGNSAANFAGSRTGIPVSQGDRDMVTTNVK